jgi:exopolyphosphatase/pppGpp-phosphohydrolase
MAAAILTDLPGQPGGLAVLTAGTAEALMRLTARQPGDDRLTRAQLASVLDDLLQRPAAATALAGVVDQARARVLPGGIIVAQTLLDRLKIDTMYISRGGLREGLLLERVTQRGTKGG